MAIASEKAMPRIMLVSKLPYVSGFRAMPVSAPCTLKPIPTPAPAAPIIARPAPTKRAASIIFPSILQASLGFSYWLYFVCFSVSFCMLFLMAVTLGGLRHKDHGEHAEHERLNDANEQFEHHDHGSQDRNLAQQARHDSNQNHAR